MVPSSSLSFDKDIKWQVMRGVHSLFAELMPVPPGPAHPSWPGKKLPFHFRFPALGKGSSHRGRSWEDDKAYIKFKVGIF